MTWQTRSSLTPKVLSENQWQLHWLTFCSMETESTHFQQAMQLYCHVRKKNTRGIGTVLDSHYQFNIMLFCRSQLLNLAYTLRVTGVKLHGVLKNLSYFNCFWSNIVKFSGDTVVNGCRISLLITFLKRRLFQLVILLQTLILLASSFTPKAIFHCGE